MASSGAQDVGTDMKLELVAVPVTDVDRAKAFYEQVGFNADPDGNRWAVQELPAR
jgi:predicted lactoylglutathione lyase